MSNIFEFDFQEDQVEVEQQPEIKQQQSEKVSDQNAFVFDEFQEEQQSQNKAGKVFQQISNKSQFLKSKQTESKNTDKLLNSNKQTQLKNNHLKLFGLEVEDHGPNKMQYVSDKKALKVNDLTKFLNTPLGQFKVTALIKKEGGIFSYSKYNVYIEQNNKFLFSVSRTGISEYIFSLDKKQVSEKKKSYLGKMTANLSGTQFIVYDNGFSPKETRSLQHCRKQIASINYEQSSGPRKFTTIISTNCQGFYSLETEQNILQEKWKKKQRDYLSIMYSKSPEFDEEDGHYKLDFKGVVKKASIKNFILGGLQWDDSLIFGKTEDDSTFIMQIKDPFSVIQAAAICISSIHYKINWK